MTDEEEPSISDEPAFIGAVGQWADVRETPVVKLIALPYLKTVYTVNLGGDVISRCVLIVSLGEHDFLLVALGDGFLLTYTLDCDQPRRAVDVVQDTKTRGKGYEIRWISF